MEAKQERNLRSNLNDDLDYFLAASAGKVLDKNLLKEFLIGNISKKELVEKLS